MIAPRESISNTYNFGGFLLYNLYQYTEQVMEKPVFLEKRSPINCLVERRGNLLLLRERGS